jgi:uncharacterized protein with NRDE domain
MCLVVVALDAHPRFALVVAANRDEYHARAAIPARWGDTAPFAGILAGRDFAAGGTWLGVRRDGRWALVTNVRDGHRNNPLAPSRGGLVPAILNGAPATALGKLMLDSNRYNGFNLLAGDARGATWASNRAAETQALAPGVHGLSNALLDTPWPKLTRTKEAVTAWVASGSEDLAPVLAALADRTKPSDEALPATGIPLAWERMLSPPFIVGEDYGTRCSTVLAVSRSGEAKLVERSFDARGDAAGDVEFAFELARDDAGTAA